MIIAFVVVSCVLLFLFFAAWQQDSETEELGRKIAAVELDVRLLKMDSERLFKRIAEANQWILEQRPRVKAKKRSRQAGGGK